jgi:hypothetical protein
VRLTLCKYDKVALKRIRTPIFAELSSSDIDEFRKEAYMMSRYVVGIVIIA